MHNIVCKESGTRQELDVVKNQTCQIIGRSWKKVYRAHTPYGVNKAYVEQAPYGAQG